MFTKFKLILVSVLLLSVFVFFYLLTTLYPEILWFESFGFKHVWWFVFQAKLVVFLITFLIAFCWIYFNLAVATSVASKTESSGEPRFDTPFSFLNQLLSQFSQRDAKESPIQLPASIVNVVRVGVVLILAALAALMAKGWWQDLYAFLNQTSFSLTDPIFGRDLSFYFFTLPAVQHAHALMVFLTVIAIGVSGWVYFYKNILLYMFTSDAKNSGIKGHMFLLFSVFFLLLALGRWINIQELLYSSTGVVYGAGYTDVVAGLLFHRVLAGLLVFEAVLLALSAFRSGIKAPIYCFVAILGVSLILGKVYPGIIQNYVVAPNELEKERQYINHNINYTRLAYGLQDVEEVEFPVKDNLTAEKIAANSNVINNIRLWNQEPLKQTFSQLQEIRLYYEFNNVDVDRYLVNGAMTQVMLSARELDITQLSEQAQTWLNQRLVYTHGYGVCMSPVSQITKAGLPYFYIKDIPPVSSVGLDVSK